MKCKSYFLFNVLSNKTRWKIINSLYLSDKFVQDICKDIDEEQSKVSHNLKTLSNCNIVFSKREGKYIKYSLNKETIKPLVEIVNKHTANFCKGKCNITEK
ncbi:MAG: metalloregulator ArsR/SmtB family transcription factor [archaeon]|jgi:ArsR family transcriptional regulator|nr:metalloregulator ArsR/SmtB family transcription factor [archaeon]MDD2477734.1 metalloregulator ArsR/SmtB family transcription factor [Candidatus ainarchaeum sp.]MDD3084643.1 metalloregulator ArsR/SmtB family transcription factor [Candidatus ainarchaeum sp.]MDD4221311.1 metalloregulator ArsR/SmtB family transcription factor [Candidatus ainarchaeum sp.]MDD4662820.1 metalloregulator ArsR/SmtB family transcription factor [Candidatus ainarchaeum sp.]